MQCSWNECEHCPLSGGHRYPGVRHDGQVASNWDRQIPQTSSPPETSGHFHTATGTHWFTVTFMQPPLYRWLKELLR